MTVFSPPPLLQFFPCLFRELVTRGDVVQKTVHVPFV